MAYSEVKFLREEYTGERWEIYEPKYDAEDNSYMVGEAPRDLNPDEQEQEIIIIKSGDFLALINDYLGVSQEDIVKFSQTGDPQLLGEIDGEPILLPTKIESDDIDSAAP